MTTARALEELRSRCRAEFYFHYRTLRELIGRREPADALLGHAYNYGTDNALLRMAEDPESFSLPRRTPLASEDKRKGLRQVMNACVSSWWAFDAAEKRFADLREGKSPASETVLVINGRGVRIDYEKARLVFEDGNQEPVPPYLQRQTDIVERSRSRKR